MKFLHTSDLHIGLKLCEQPMNDEIAYLLDEIVSAAVENDCSAVVIAGDIYDRSNPSPDSIKLFDDFVSKLVGNNITVIAISGNHDSAERIGCFSGILKKSGVYFSTPFDGKTNKVRLYDEYGAVNFIMLPFVKPSVCEIYADENITSYTDAVRYQLECSDCDKSERNVVAAHCYTGDRAYGKTEDDEAGGTGYISPEVFDDYDYTALGHLHTAHNAGDKIWYSGSVLRCSFAEREPVKSVNIVTLLEKGNLTVEQIPLKPMHEIRELRGTYDELTSLEVRQSAEDGDYIKAVLTDDDDIPDVVMKLRIIYPNLLTLSYDNKRTQDTSIDSDEVVGKITDSFTPEDVFAELYELQNGVTPTDEIKKIVSDIFTEGVVQHEAD